MIVQPNYMAYPSDYPVVSSLGFSGSVDTGVSRSSEQGFPSQERYAGTNPTTVNLRFRMSLQQFKHWSFWIQRNAVSKWVTIDLPSPNGRKAAGPNAPLTNQVVRFGSYTMTPLGGGSFVEVSTSAQLMPTGVGIGLAGTSGGVILPGGGDWIIARTPADPSADWYIAKTPTAPSTDTVTAGTPATAN